MRNREPAFAINNQDSRMRKFPIGIQNFESLRNDGYLYIDKTRFVHKLTHEGRYYFLSRPRRFGKSLLLSTIEAYFLGKRELFKGLAIDSLTEEWDEHVVLRLDLNSQRYDYAEALHNILDGALSRWESDYGLEKTSNTMSLRFADVIRRVHQQSGRRVVILIDEYDKPLLQTFDKPELQTDFRNELKAFYGVMKSCDEHIRFALLTGVTRFSKVSVFSDLNNLEEISMLPQYAEVCGLTEQELRDNLDEDIQALADRQKMTKEACYEELKLRYDGYHFCEDDEVGMYNPFSLLNTLKSQKFGDYWFATGTPTILVEYLKRTHYNLNDLTTEAVSSSELNSIDSMERNPLPLIYQSGYLTIKAYDSEFDEYTLGFPNKEVEEGFIKYLSKYFIPESPGSEFTITQFVKDLRAGKAESFMQRLDTLFATGNYQVVGDLELYLQNSLYVFFKLLGFYVDVERHTSDGRMDMVVQTPSFIYLFEFKRDQSAAAALQQIEDKQYAKPFALDSRQIFRIGINFSTELRRIDDWKIV